MQVSEVFYEHFTPLESFSTIVNQIFNMKNNVSQLNNALKQFVSLGAEVNTLIEDLSDSKKILDVYKRLMILIKLRKSLISRFKNTDYMKNRHSDLKIQDLEDKLSGIKELEEKFRDKMKSFMQNHQIIIPKQPAFWIKIMRIIECDGRINEINSKPQELKTIQEEVEGTDEESKRGFSTFKSKYDDIDFEKPEDEMDLKEFCLKHLNDTVKNQASEAYKTAYDVDSIVDISERLIYSLSNVDK